MLLSDSAIDAITPPTADTWLGDLLGSLGDLLGGDVGRLRGLAGAAPYGGDVFPAANVVLGRLGLLLDAEPALTLGARVRADVGRQQTEAETAVGSLVWRLLQKFDPVLLRRAPAPPPFRPDAYRDPVPWQAEALDALAAVRGRTLGRFAEAAGAAPADPLTCSRALVALCSRLGVSAGEQRCAELCGRAASAQLERLAPDAGSAAGGVVAAAFAAIDRALSAGHNDEANPWVRPCDFGRTTMLIDATGGADTLAAFAAGVTTGHPCHGLPAYRTADGAAVWVLGPRRLRHGDGFYRLSEVRERTEAATAAVVREKERVERERAERAEAEARRQQATETARKRAEEARLKQMEAKIAALEAEIAAKTTQEKKT